MRLKGRSHPALFFACRPVGIIQPSSASQRNTQCVESQVEGRQVDCRPICCGGCDGGGAGRCHSLQQCLHVCGQSSVLSLCLTGRHHHHHHPSSRLALPLIPLFHLPVTTKMPITEQCCKQCGSSRTQGQGINVADSRSTRATPDVCCWCCITRVSLAWPG